MGGEYAIALASADMKVFSAAPVFKFFSSHLTIYLLSSFVASSSNFTIIFSFSYWELFPEDLAIFLQASNTCLKVRPALGSVEADFFVKKEPKVF